MRALLAAGALSMAFTLFLTPAFIRTFRRLGWGQFIRDDGPKSHHSKRGTPTMGGIVFIFGTIFGYLTATYLVSGEQPSISGLLVLFLMVGLGVVGFVDDYLKTRRKQSLGLGGWAKIVGQVVVAGVFAVLVLQFPNKNGVTPGSTKVSLVRDLPIDFLYFGTFIGVSLFILWVCLISVGASNSVNVTDGLDGLAGGASVIAIGSFVIIGFWQFNQDCAQRFDRSVDLQRCYEVRDPLDLAIIATAITGGLIGFLWWNTNPARLYMGDTGSLALGGALAALSILSRTELLLLLIGGLFVIESGSVIMQRLYFKLTKGKRIFLMSPIHHHFELKGWAEVTIVVRFWIVCGILAVAGVGGFYLEWLQR